MRDGADEGTGPMASAVDSEAADADASAGALASRYDVEQNIIKVECEGLWTPAQIDRCFVELSGLIATMRARHNRVRVFVDRRKTQVQSPETTERLLFHTGRAYRPEDRVAVLVDTSLAKLQSRQSVDGRTHAVFVSEHAAMTWLKAHN